MYKAAKHNFDISEKAMCEIGTFALKMGRQDVLDEYRASVAGIMQGADGSGTEYRRSSYG